MHHIIYRVSLAPDVPGITEGLVEPLMFLVSQRDSMTLCFCWYHENRTSIASLPSKFRNKTLTTSSTFLMTMWASSCQNLTSHIQYVGGRRRGESILWNFLRYVSNSCFVRLPTSADYLFTCCRCCAYIVL